MSSGKEQSSVAPVYGGCDPTKKDGGCNCCSDHTVLPGSGPPDPQRYCDKAHGSTFQSVAGGCPRHWTKINNTCTAADYLEEFMCKYIGIRRPRTEAPVVIPRGIITPIVMTDLRVDTTNTHSTPANGIVLPCKAVWDIQGRVWFKHPLEVTNDPPATNGVLSPDAVLTIYIGRNGGYSYSREYSPAQFVNPLWIPVSTDRTECLGRGDTFTLSVHWEDPTNLELQELEVSVASLTAAFVCYCDGSVV